MMAGLPSSTAVGSEFACDNLPQSGRRTQRRDAPLRSRPDPGSVTLTSGCLLCLASAASLQIQTGKRCDTGTAKNLCGDPLFAKLAIRLVQNVKGSCRMAQTVKMEVVHVSAFVARAGMLGPRSQCLKYH